MPISDEPLKEKVPFDVYSMMLILGFMATAGAVAFLNDDLQQHWYAGEQPGVVDHAEHITTLNSLLEDREKWYEYLTSEDITTISTEIEVTEKDLEDRRRIIALDSDHVEEDLTPPEYTPYPAWINPIDNPVNTTSGHDNTEGVPPEVLEGMLNKYMNVDTGAAAAEDVDGEEEAAEEAADETDAAKDATDTPEPE